MASNARTRPEIEFSSRLFRFAHFEFDEAGRELRAHGRAVELESKPIEVLYQLLLRPGEVVTKEELLESAWPGVTVVEGSLATAVSKLRKALGDESPSVILTVPRLGYRLGVPVQVERVTPPPVRELGYLPGQAVPGRDRWVFVRKLDASASSEVWLAEHPKTHEERVFKFASDGLRLKGLKREVTLARLLKDSLGERPDLVRVVDWNFDTQPFYLESEFCGPNMAEWAEGRGGLSAIPLAERLQAMADLAAGVAAAHSIGVLHKDLKPANVLMAPRPEGGVQVKVADFGSGTLVEPSRLVALGITNIGLTQTITGNTGALTGTLMYLPPEVLAGQAPTASADVYALGVMLYQMLAGDFRKPLSPGWETDIADPLLREDIAEAACGDPARRIASVAALAERLQTLDARRVQRNELAQTRERARVAERRLELSRVRRPWIGAAVLALIVGLAASLFLYSRAVSERDRANRQTAIAADVNRFLANDLLGRSDPFQTGSQETLLSAVKQASANIDRQFQNAPEVAARLHQTIGKALDNRSDFPGARAEYDRAAALFLQSEGRLSQDALALQFQRAAMEARTYEKDSLPRARAILAQQEPLLAQIQSPRADLPVLLAFARGMIALIGNDAKMAAAQFGAAYDGASKLPEFDELARLTFKQRLAFASIRLGDGAQAERLFRELIASFTRIGGPDSASVLRVRLNLAQAFMIEGKNREAIQETTAIYPEYVARLGADHELSMQALTTRAQCEGTLGLWDDATRDDLAIYNLALHKQGPTSFFAVATLSDAALAQCRGGHTAEGEPNARKAYDASLKAFGARAGLTGGAAYTLASCAIDRGQFAEAGRLLQNIDTPAVAQLAGFPDWAANVTLAQAQIAYREGDYAAAQKYLQSARPAFAKPDAEPYQKHAVESLAAALQKTVVGQK
ncbi:MAG TPA: winged helix-turn-helix domain-containing protein [Candidatus Sulfopaludibacter sp.]|jgi:DNA-binding winged helix-turn-helix (wHTH) protein/serine/threonine protein kinase|nr:winged helix-turn-helix domain-containing protein [Candidatus Sulfopaludibacter sp.]